MFVVMYTTTNSLRDYENPNFDSICSTQQPKAINEAFKFCTHIAFLAQMGIGLLILLLVF